MKVDWATIISVCLGAMVGQIIGYFLIWRQ
jgi:membrane protein DedA with SNARE-associated domain